MSIESKIYLDLARIWNVGPGEVEKMVRDYIGAVTCEFKPLQTYPKPHVHIKPVKVKSLKEKLEEIKMNATSTENFHDVIAIDFELQTFPDPDVQDKFIVSATNRDDIFCFVFEGPHIVDTCRKAGLFTGWEKDQKIRELEKELSEWKKEASDCLRLRDEARRENNREINKLHQQLHQAEHDKKSLTWKNEQLTQENEKLKELKTPTIENFADEEPSSRSDILDLAKKCVCGKREQDYGTPESNFQLIADLWNDYLGLCENGDGVPIFSIKSITPTDVAMMMALMKIARIRNGGGSGDSFVDLAGYAACGGEIWHSNKETNGDSN